MSSSQMRHRKALVFTKHHSPNYWRAHWKIPPAAKVRAMMERLKPKGNRPDLRA